MASAGIRARGVNEEPSRIASLRIPGRVSEGASSARAADRRLIAQAPRGFLDTTHFDTVRFPPPERAHAAFAAASADGDKAYSPYRGDAQVLERVAANVSDLLGVPVDPDRNVILTPGTQAGLFASLGSLVEPGARVALVNPEYLFSERILGFYGAEIAPITLNLVGANGPSPDLEALEREFRNGAKVFVFSHPNNPTGAVYSAETLAKMAELCVEYNVTVIADELYSRLLHGSTPFNHMVSQPSMQGRTVTLLGPSKTESFSGYRVGVVVAPADLIDRIEDVQSITSLRAPAYAQHLLPHWLSDDKEWLEERLKAFTNLRTITAAAFAQLPWLNWTPGNGTAYAWPNVGALNMPAYDVAEALLTKAGALVSPGYQFGPGNDAHFRVCYARDEAIWQAALERMVSVLDELAVARGLPGRTS